MGTSILGVGQSALNAAQIGLQTTGHNIANVNTPGYSRQVIVQSTAGGQDIGSGFVGKGTEVTTVKRVYNEYLSNQVVSAQVSSSALSTYYSQIQQIDNMLADPTAGVASAVQDFFNGVQDVASNPSSDASRQAMLSSANALAARFQSVGDRLDQLSQGVNDQITTSVKLINSYAQQIASLNDSIEKAQGTSGENKPANDLLDQRDQIISELSKEINVSVVKQGNSYNVFIGNGQALTVGTQVFSLSPAASLTDPSKIQVAYTSNGKTSILADSSLPGGNLGGLLDFRNNSLTPARNSLGQMAIGMAMSFNAQHELGQDKNGALGGAFFTAGAPVVNASSANTSAATVTATIVDASQLTTSNYRVQRINGTGGPGVDYLVTRVSDGQTTKFAGFPQTIDGITFANPTGTMASGDEFLVQPTVAAATGFSVKVNDIAQIAAATPMRAAVGSANTGSGKISAGTVNSTGLLPSGVKLTYDATAGQITSMTPSTAPITVKSGATTTVYPPGSTNIPFATGDSLSIDGVPVTFPTTANGTFTFNSPTSTTLTFASGSFTGFPAYEDVTIVHADGTKQVVAGASPAASVPYKDGDTISFGGVSFTISGAPADGDQFTISPNSSGVGDNRNALQLASLQTAKTLAGGNTYQTAYTSMVAQVGNKTKELEVTSSSADKLLAQSVEAQQSESGVNLDEEAANMMRYQQAYQAAAKVMQTAGQLFDLLLTLGQ
ncbi:MAG TPA: flagellar hook-associated protein FlgK [Noviherbaspirillum sp.]|uniref:flagellar hook-associated protein FlgK n=1 Tax=Noviherbaspirillum sp. TaxID=1926288 RepID=UPI002B48599D|nr:flagellar hook-associated protein FlgK [Noviherbaspirillum sp.]HJV88489.1 flagellar hook-associated protein FlgK [Noviherbaspirillum sp.]